MFADTCGKGCAVTLGKPTTRDARAVLGVTATATPAQVVTAFRRHARAMHPDVSHTRDAADRFAALVAAYHVALGAAHGDREERRADLGARASSTAHPESPPTKFQAGAGGAAVILEAGRPVLLVAPVAVHPPSARPDGWRDARGNDP